ncbi:MAG: hypothetical protein N3I35_07045 [Clostridia bacterium]|nr:hypothetical protein [Clostridia bacterium]
MSEKIKVFLEVDPNTEVVIKPIAAELSSLRVKSNIENGASIQLDATATATGGPGHIDADVDIPF